MLGSSPYHAWPRAQNLPYLVHYVIDAINDSFMYAMVHFFMARLRPIIIKSSISY